MGRIYWISEQELFIERFLFDMPQNIIYDLSRVSFTNILDSIPKKNDSISQFIHENLSVRKTSDSEDVSLGIKIIAIIFAGLTALSAVVTACFVYRQHKLEKTKLKLEAYDRRIKIYDAINKFITGLLVKGAINNEDLTTLIRETKHAEFLFAKDDKITEYINLMYNKGVDLEYIEKDVKEANSEKKRKELIEKSRKLREWFKNQGEVVNEKFRQYLQISGERRS